MFSAKHREMTKMTITLKLIVDNCTQRFAKHKMHCKESSAQGDMPVCSITVDVNGNSLFCDDIWYQYFMHIQVI